MISRPSSPTNHLISFPIPPQMKTRKDKSKERILQSLPFPPPLLMPFPLLFTPGCGLPTPSFQPPILQPSKQTPHHSLPKSHLSNPKIHQLTPKTRRTCLPLIVGFPLQTQKHPCYPFYPWHQTYPPISFPFPTPSSSPSVCMPTSGTERSFLMGEIWR